MKKSLLLLLACLFGALSGVKAWTSVVPEDNRWYLLYNMWGNSYWYGTNATYNHVAGIADATPIKVESGHKLAFIYGTTTYRIYHSKGTKEPGNTVGVNFTFEGSATGDWGYQLMSKNDDKYERYMNDVGQFQRENYSNRDWQFFAYEEVLPSIVEAKAPTCASTAEASYVSGWERVTTKEQLAQNPERYFYAIFSAVNPGVMMTTEYNDSKYRMCYKAAGNPLSSSSYDLFEMENYDGEFAIKSNITGKYYGNTSGAPWDFQANQETLNDDCKITVTCSNGVYNLQDRYADSYAATDPFVGNYLGAWDNMEFVGERLAGNKGQSRAGYFLIYRKLKKDLGMTSRITNPSFEAENISEWSCTTGGDTGRKENSGNYVMSNVAGSYLFNTWNNGSASEVSQTLSNMPSGFYTLSAVMASDNNETLRLKVGNDVIATSKATGAGNGIETSGSFGFAGGNMTISADANGHWYKVDNFRLTYLGGMEDLTPVSGLMNADVNTAQQNAVNNYNSNKTAANYIAATEAIAAAEVSKAAYAQINSSDLTAYRTKIGNVLTKTNVYTTEAYNKWYANVQDNYNNGVYTNEEVVTLAENGAYNSEWRSSNRVDDILMSTWDEVPMNWNSYHINTWSGEGSEDGSDFLVPFFEYWVAGENVLEAKTMTSTVTGLEANTEYSVNIWARVRQTDNQSKVAGSITMQVGSGLTVDLTTGTPVGSTQFYLNHFTATGSTNGEGQLTITINVAANSNISWLSFKDVAISKQATSGDVQAYSGLINEDVELEPTPEYPIVDITGATFTGDITAHFGSNPNGIIYATSAQKIDMDAKAGGPVKNVISSAYNVCERLVITDGYPFVAPFDFEATNATYSRTVGASTNFGTICVPFALTSNGDIQYYTTDQITGGVLKLTEVNNVAAGTPAIFKKQDSEATNIIASTMATAVKKDAGEQGSSVVLKGTFERITIGTDGEEGTKAANGKYYINSSNQFCEGKDWFYVGAFRAYLKTTGDSPARLTISTDNETAINELKTLDEKQGLKDGKYLIGGKIIVVKAGKQYNVNGVIK